MTPLVDLAVLSKEQNIDDLFIKSNLSQADFFAVYENRIDNIIGYIDIIDVFNSTKKNKQAKDFLQKNIYIPENISLDKLYKRFAEYFTDVFIVVDEYGGCSGIVTEKDVTNRIFGFDYYLEKSKKKLDKTFISQIDKNNYEVDTLFDIDEFSQFFKVSIKKQGFETLGGFINHLFSKIPLEGETKKWKNLQFSILKASQKSVDLVQITKK